MATQQEKDVLNKGSNTGEILAGFLIFIFGITIALLSIPLFRTTAHHDIGPGAFPLIVGILISLCGILEAIDLIRRSPEYDILPTKTRVKMFAQYRRELQLIALLILYIAVIRQIGFLISTIGFLIIACRLFGAKGWTGVVFVSLGVSIGFFWLFVKLLALTLPRGFLGV